MTAGPLPRHAVDHRNPRPARISGIAGDAASARGQSKAICTRDHGPDRMWPAPHNKMTAGRMDADGSAALAISPQPLTHRRAEPSVLALNGWSRWARTVGQIRRLLALPQTRPNCTALAPSTLAASVTLDTKLSLLCLWIFLVVSWLAGGDEGVIIAY